MGTREDDRRWRERNPDKAKEVDAAKRARWLAKPGNRERERIKRIARYHGITYEEAKERDAARKRKHHEAVHHLSSEHYTHEAR